VRHRLLAALLDGHASGLDLDATAMFANRRVLHFAPERQLRERIRRTAAEYLTADFDRGDCEVRLDVSRMPEIADCSFDAILICDVLEHVPSDVEAMRELHRVLTPGGIAILTVPQRDPPALTDEDQSVQSETERETRFGQKDHVRMYGDDFGERVATVGFRVQVVADAQFSAELVRRHVLAPPQRSRHPLATNFRRIFLAQRLAHAASSS
jgi:SAM-dependent methyltransferase